jgi:hypothetical protein
MYFSLVGQNAGRQRSSYTWVVVAGGKTMSLPRTLACTIVLAFSGIAVSALAQVPMPVPRIGRTPLPETARHPKAPRQVPCWQEAGVTKATMEERRSIEQRSRAEIQAVCANSSLSPEQRREQIRSIHERTRQQVNALISPQQREAIKSCQEARASHTGGGGLHHVGVGGGGERRGPCGELIEPRQPAREAQP